MRCEQPQSCGKSAPQAPFAILVIFLIALGIQTGFTWFAVRVVQYPISAAPDAWEYVGITDNVLAGHGFAVERTFPWRPDGARTPGMLFVNIPLRRLFPNHDLYAALASRIVLALIGIMVGIMAMQLLANPYGLLAGAILILTPSVSYYTINPFETELHYLLALSGLFLGISLAFTRRLVGVLVVVVASGYAMLLRPAAQFPLLAVALVCFIWCSVARAKLIKRTALWLGASVVIGTCSAYLLWCARNDLVFGAFTFSTVPGFNLLHFNAAGMRPFLDHTAAQEVSEALAAYPIRIQRYYGSDQFAVAAEQARVGLNLLKKYPLAFFSSHLVGSFRAFLVFEPMILNTHFGILPVYLISLVQLGFTAGGLVGVARGWKSCDARYHLVLTAMLVAGIVSVLSAGVLASPRFRFPLEIPLALGWAKLVGERRQRVRVLGRVCKLGSGLYIFWDEQT
jgi:hypothetical protein